MRALAIYGGVEDYITDGVLKDGEWSSWENIVLGAAVSAFSCEWVGPLLEKINLLL